MVGVITVVRDQVVRGAAQSRNSRCVIDVLLLCVSELASGQATARAVVVVLS